jgi:hypothetical protein
MQRAYIFSFASNRKFQVLMKRQMGLRLQSLNA